MRSLMGLYCCSSPPVVGRCLSTLVIHAVCSFFASTSRLEFMYEVVRLPRPPAAGSEGEERVPGWPNLLRTDVMLRTCPPLRLVPSPSNLRTAPYRVKREILSILREINFASVKRTGNLSHEVYVQTGNLFGYGKTRGKYIDPVSAI